MMRYGMPILLALGVLVVAASAPGEPGGAAGRWVALDLSASMDYDAVCTGNEQQRCSDLYVQDHELGDEDGDLRGTTVDRNVDQRVVFGDHQLGTPWSSLSYVVAGDTYANVGDPSKEAVRRTLGAGEGLPADGRVGIYRLYMDELEHPQWALSTAADRRHGRNAIAFRHNRNQYPNRTDIPLAAAQHGRYSKLSVLFAAPENSSWSQNDVRLLAVYADGEPQVLWRGRLGTVRGNSVIGWGKAEYRLPEGQRAAIEMTSAVMSSTYRPLLRDKFDGFVTMNEFAAPLRLDPSRVLTGLAIENADEKTDASYVVYLFAVSVLPAEQGNP